MLTDRDCTWEFVLEVFFDTAFTECSLEMGWWNENVVTATFAAALLAALWQEAA